MPEWRGRKQKFFRAGGGFVELGHFDSTQEKEAP